MGNGRSSKLVAAPRIVKYIFDLIELAITYFTTFSFSLVVHFLQRSIDAILPVPYQASIQDINGGHLCNGVLIDSYVVLTAASCVTGYLSFFEILFVRLLFHLAFKFQFNSKRAEDIVISVGSNKLENTSKYPLAAIKTHPQFKPSATIVPSSTIVPSVLVPRYDLAVLIVFLGSQLNTNFALKSINITKETNLTQSEQIQVTGWGRRTVSKIFDCSSEEFFKSIISTDEWRNRIRITIGYHIYSTRRSMYSQWNKI